MRSTASYVSPGRGGFNSDGEMGAWFALSASEGVQVCDTFVDLR